MRYWCKCGQHLSNSNNPEIQYKVFSDAEWLNLLDRTESGEKPLDFTGNRIGFWKCTNCKRLIFWEPENDTAIAIYKIEMENKEDWYPDEDSNK